MSKPLKFEEPIFELREQILSLREKEEIKGINLSDESKSLEKKVKNLEEEVYNNLTSWQRVQIARHIDRPFTLDYISYLFEDFYEIHGDRHIGDDMAMPGGFALFRGIKVVVLGHQKGRNTKENIERNFGSGHPEGYRKALRLMKLAEKFQLPVISFIDTPGAFPGIGAEQRNISEAIAFNLKEMMTLNIPILNIVIGEGGSGGALGIGVGDRLLIMENAYYSVISPEGCATILWKDSLQADKAAEALKLSAENLKNTGLANEVIKEPQGGAHRNHIEAFEYVGEAIARHLNKLIKISPKTLLKNRYQRFRSYGEWVE